MARYDRVLSRSSRGDSHIDKMAYVLLPIDGPLLPAVTALESASYPPDEAATPQRLTFRAAHAAPFFKVLLHLSDSQQQPPVLIGFVCGTLTSAARQEAASMATHDPTGTTLCIHSVVIAASERRRGLGGWMLRRYLAQVAEAAPAVSRVLLLTKPAHMAMYESAGFSSLGASAVEHGVEPWIEMARWGDAAW